VIDEALQDDIRNAYQQLTDALKLKPRWGQRQMIAEVANALGDPEGETPIAVVEAGTGTGKTIAYLVATLPIARARGKRVVVASATIALQEQLLLRDLPIYCATVDLSSSRSWPRGEADMSACSNWITSSPGQRATH